MEVSISILDTFPSLSKLSQKNNLLLEYNNKEYNLKNIINQQDIFSIKENRDIFPEQKNVPFLVSRDYVMGCYYNR